MSSMVINRIAALLLASALTTSAPVVAQIPAEEWDRARADLVATQAGAIAGAITQWQALSSSGSGSSSFSFLDYANFLISYPGFPDESRLQTFAEERLKKEYAPNERIVAFFDRYPPITNAARAQYALALMAERPTDAELLIKEAWRGGAMSETAATSILASYSAYFTQDDHDARMDALLWQRERALAERQLPYVSPDRRPVFLARLAILQGGDGAVADPAALSDPGYLYNRSRELRLKNRTSEVVSLLANRPPLSSLPFNPTAWVEEQLNVARLADARSAQTIAAKIDDAFPQGADISGMPYKLRDDYTSLVWLGGTRALWDLGDGTAAAPLFYRYGAAARTPPTRSKGFFWAGHAAGYAGDNAEAQRYYEMAAQYGDKFYGQMALSRMGRPLPEFADLPLDQPTPDERATFSAAPLTLAVAEVARDAPWSTGIRFYRAIADQAETLGEHILVAELARSIGRRDLAVNLADSAAASGHTGFVPFGFPTLSTPPGTDWTMVHAISRQESQFAHNAISHAGARGLMQLMPGTAREEAQKAGIAYLDASLIDDPSYNIRLGSNHIQRLYSRYGSWPLAIAAYNAGPGNVNKWLAQNGDPRTGAVSWIDWIEKIPFFETKNYVTRVIENAVVYEKLYPDFATHGRSRQVEEFLR